MENIQNATYFNRLLEDYVTESTDGLSRKV